MGGFVVTVRQRTRAGVSGPLVLWALVTAVVLVVGVVAPSGGDALIGLAASVLLGVYLGVKRRIATVLVAPVVSWLFAAVPLVVAWMVHDGFFKGLFYGLLYVSVGWIGVGLSEILVIGFVALAVRLLTGKRRDGPVVYFEPGERPR